MRSPIVLVVFVLIAVSMDPVHAQAKCKSACSSSTPEPYSPVCDNNGNGYDNPKELECNQCLSPDRNIRLGYLGECHDFSQAADAVACRQCSGADSPFAPLCDSQGKEHRSYSAFRCAQFCNPSLRVASYGKC